MKEPTLLLDQSLDRAFGVEVPDAGGIPRGLDGGEDEIGQLGFQSGCDEGPALRDLEFLFFEIGDGDEKGGVDAFQCGLEGGRVAEPALHHNLVYH